MTRAFWTLFLLCLLFKFNLGIILNNKAQFIKRIPHWRPLTNGFTAHIVEQDHIASLTFFHKLKFLNRIESTILKRVPIMVKINDLPRHFISLRVTTERSINIVDMVLNKFSCLVLQKYFDFILFGTYYATASHLFNEKRWSW